MTDDTASLVLEILKRVQGDLALVREEMHGVRLEMTSVRQHMAALLTDELRQDSDIASIKLRLDRIERRLDLTE